MEIKKVDRFHRLKHLIPQMVRKTINGNEVIHGSRAVNIQVGSPHLKTHTQDYDVYSDTPKKSAQDTERYLDKQFSHNAFETKKGISPNTYRVRSRATGTVYADFTKPTNKIPHKKILGKKYATLQHQQQHAEQTLKAGTATHRKQKDIDVINRIKLNKQQNIRW